MSVGSTMNWNNSVTCISCLETEYIFIVRWKNNCEIKRVKIQNLSIGQRKCWGITIYVKSGFY